MNKKKPLSIEDEARRLAPECVSEMLGDPETLVTNGRICCDSLSNAKELLHSSVMGWDPSRVSRFGALVSAFKKAAHVVTTNEVGADHELSSALSLAWPLRNLMLDVANRAAERGALDGKLVEKLSASSSALDCAQDLIKLAALFEKQWDTVGKNWGLVPSDLESARSLAATITAAARRSKKKRLSDSEVRKARISRDRLFTLMHNARKELFGAAALAFGEDGLDEKYPRLDRQRPVSPAAPLLQESKPVEETKRARRKKSDSPDEAAAEGNPS